jgi:F-type H+-transporting ATPase subunit delta
MSVTKIAEPYAEALLELSISDSSNEITTDMNVVSQFLASSNDLKNFLGNPLITRSSKKKVIKDVLGEQISSQTLNFLMLLVDRNRISILDTIAKRFLELSYKRDSIEIAKVTYSVPLSAEQQKNLAVKLKSVTGANQIKLALKIDPSLIGGFTVEIGSKLIDTSIRGQLKQITTLLGA